MASGESAPAEGRRERKKRETRQRISDIATGLMMDRGFDAVTIAEIAEAADVSVNTVYNHFPAKEDLFFDREEEMASRPSRIVRERKPGESAADALLKRMRADVAERNIHGGAREGFEAFARCVRDAPTLIARLHVIQQRTADHLAETLREEASATPGDPRPDLVAGQLTNLGVVVFRSTSLAVARGVEEDQVVRDALHRIDVFESLVSEEFLNYAVRSGG
ncbi:MAG TPA: TetR/AcrR family transcriptional regulator [Streptomyces sp.]|nr:TetR/AcrR family transcriptional regulator [Streptomyces sp.]